MSVVNVKHGAVHFSNDDQAFSVELSDLGDNKVWDACNRHAPIVAHNPKTGKRITMQFVKADMDGSNEDCYGYHYKGFNPDNDRSFTFLFIND